MALTFTEIEKTVWGPTQVRVVDVTFDGAYPAGGEPITAEDFGLEQLLFVQPGPAIAANELTAVVVGWDRADSTLVCYTGATAGNPLDEAGAADVDALVSTVLVYGH